MEPVERGWRVAEAIAWCAQSVGPAHGPGRLRSPELEPSDYCEAGTRNVREHYTKSDWERWVAEVADTRARLLRERGHYPSAPTYDLAGGRVVLYLPDEQLADGAAEQASEGLFDPDNAPAWDTWLWCEQPTYPAGDGRVGEWWVAALIPEWALDAALVGIWVNPEICIQWARVSSDLGLQSDEGSHRRRWSGPIDPWKNDSEVRQLLTAYFTRAGMQPPTRDLWWRKG